MGLDPSPQRKEELLCISRACNKMASALVGLTNQLVFDQNIMDWPFEVMASFDSGHFGRS